MWLFPLHSAPFFVWGSSFRNTSRRDWKDRGWKERMPGELYITGSGGIQTNQKGRRGLLPWSWQLCSLKWEMMLQPDGVRLDTRDTCKFAGAHMCVEKHTHTHILHFLSLADTLEKAKPERDETTLSSLMCVSMYTSVRMLYMCVCVKQWESRVSRPAQCVTSYRNPDPSQRTPSRHQSKSLKAPPPPGLHCRVSFERLSGSFAAGCPLSKNMHETG